MRWREQGGGHGPGGGLREEGGPAGRWSVTQGHARLPLGSQARRVEGCGLRLLIYTRWLNPDNPQQTLRTPPGCSRAQTGSGGKAGASLGSPPCSPGPAPARRRGHSLALPAPHLGGSEPFPAPSTQCTELWVSWAPCSAWEADLSGVPNPVAPRSARWREAPERRKAPSGWGVGRVAEPGRDQKSETLCPGPVSAGPALPGLSLTGSVQCTPTASESGGCRPGLSAEWELVARRGPSGERDQAPGGPAGDGLRNSHPPAWPEPAV